MNVLAITKAGPGAPNIWLEVKIQRYAITTVHQHMLFVVAKTAPNSGWNPRSGMDRPRSCNVHSARACRGLRRAPRLHWQDQLVRDGIQFCFTFLFGIVLFIVPSTNHSNPLVCLLSMLLILVCKLSNSTSGRSRRWLWSAQVLHPLSKPRRLCLQLGTRSNVEEDKVNSQLTTTPWSPSFYLFFTVIIRSDNGGILGCKGVDPNRNWGIKAFRTLHMWCK